MINTESIPHGLHSPSGDDWAQAETSLTSQTNTVLPAAA